MGRLKPDVNVTFRLDPDIVFWARMRAFTHGTSLNAVLKRFLDVMPRCRSPGGNAIRFRGARGTNRKPDGPLAKRYPTGLRARIGFVGRRSTLRMRPRK